MGQGSQEPIGTVRRIPRIIRKIIHPADSHPPILYPFAAIAAAKPQAARYLAFLRSAAAKNVFERYGFSVLAKPTS